MTKKAGKTRTAKKSGRSKKGGKGTFPWSLIIAAAVTFAAGVVFMLLVGDRLFKPGVEEAPTREIQLYFSNEVGKALAAERRSIRRSSLEGELGQAVEALIKGPRRGSSLAATIPSGTKLLSLEVQGNTAYVNLSKEIVRNHSGGSSAELQTIYSIVNTLALNFEEIDTVQILVEGEVRDTLKGHIVMGIPLAPDRKMIKG